MKIVELLESANNNLLADAEDLLIAAKASGIDEIKTTDIVKQLNNTGHPVTLDGLVTLLQQDSQIAISVDTNTIKLNKLPEVDPKEKEDNKEKVSKMATKSGLRGVKKNV